MFNDSLSHTDPALLAMIAAENQRQEQHIELIASENYVSRAVLEAQGSVLTNKYAEGYPGKRYYGGCEFVDEVENIAIERAKTLFGAAYANVQPHSGASANAAIYFSLLRPGDTVLGMDLAQGGHLTHGSPANFSGKLFNVISYGLDVNEVIDYQQVERLAQEHRPKMIVAGASAYALKIDFERFAAIAKAVGAYLWVDMAHYAGLVAAGLYPNPVPFADVVTTTTHKTLRGPRGGMILARDESLAKTLNSAIFPLMQGGPLMHVVAAKAVALAEALGEGFVSYQKQVLANAKALAQALQDEGLRVVSGGTDCHLMLVDLQAKNVSGKTAEAALGRAFITVNKNAIPNDPQSPFVTSGIRLGTPAVTTRGFDVDHMQHIARWISAIVTAPSDEALITRTREQVLQLCQQFPVYGGGR